VIKAREYPRPAPVGPQNNSHSERIIAVAAEIFLEKGYEQTRTAEIANRAKLSKRELYANFKDKKDILTAVIGQLQAEIHAEANISWSSTDDLRKVLTRAGTQIHQFMSSQRFGKLFRIVAAETLHDRVSAHEFYLLGPDTGRKNTALFIKRHMKEGSLRKADALKAADDFLDLVIGARHLTAVVLGQKQKTLHSRSHVEHAVDMFLSYYGVQKKPMARYLAKNQ
jgi:TetR/AcrR family transcriptional repressor of mexJK operon